MFKEKTKMKEHKQNNLKFYEVSERYIEYLKQFDNKIPNLKYETREKFVCGILFNINGNEYYAPVSSFNKPQKTNYVIKIGEYPVGSIRFSFMFPVPKSEIKIKNFSKENQDYKYLINSEYLYCKEHKGELVNKARNVYQRTVNDVPTYKQNCCKFKLLEDKCKEWELSHKKEKKDITKNKLPTLSARITNAKGIKNQNTTNIKGITKDFSKQR
ncbi:MAG: type III toxin-antitoxin system ToxN/AbiQ family toxin [Bacilli bacterium]